MKILNRIIKFFFLSSLFILQDTSAASESWPDIMQVPVNQVVTSLADVWELPPRMHDAIEKHGVTFDQALDLLVIQLPSDLIGRVTANEADDLHAKLIAIALYRKDHSARIDEIINHFTIADLNSQSSRRVLRPPEVSMQWARSEDRLAWEYILLRPGIKWEFFFMQRIQEALSLIDDPASVLTITTAFRATLTSNALPSKNRMNFQRHMIEALVHMPNVKSLKALLNIEKWIKSAPVYVGEKEQITKWNSLNEEIIDFPAKALQSYISDKEKQTWKAVIEDFSKQLSVEDSKNLKNMIRLLEKKR